MDKLINELYQNYGKYCNFRCLPSEIDGLKPVEKRVLLSTYEIAKNKFVKSARIEGHTIGHYHPHGSIYDTLVQLVHQGFVIGQGSWGFNIGEDDDSEAAAMRYTEAMLNPTMERLAFELVNYVPWEAIDLDKEPLYLPVMYPLCLLGSIYTIGIGFGYRTLIPTYNECDLYKRLLYLLGIRKRKPIIKPVSDCEIISTDEELDNLLTIGKSKIKMRGIFTINQEDYSVSLKSWPIGKKCESLINKFKNELDQEDIGYNDFSEATTNIVFKVIKQRNRSLILDSFIKKLIDEITSDIPFEINVINSNRNVRLISVDEFILNSYNNYKHFSLLMLHDRKKQFEDILNEFEILTILRPFLSKHLKKLNSDYSETIGIISKESKIEVSVITSLFSKYKINKLLTLNIDSEEIKNKILKYDELINKINDYVLNKYQEGNK